MSCLVEGSSCPQSGSLWFNNLQHTGIVRKPRTSFEKDGDAGINSTLSSVH